MVGDPRESAIVDLLGHLGRLALPGIVALVVDVAVGAIQVTARGNLQDEVEPEVTHQITGCLRRSRRGRRLPRLNARKRGPRASRTPRRRRGHPLPPAIARGPWRAPTAAGR